MRKPGRYGQPRYHDPNDRRMVQIIKPAERAMPRAVNIVGVPFDGAVLGRRGAAGGPAAVREAMQGLSNYNVELGVGLEGARVYDLGDLIVEP
ncbi:MAG: arginase family protein, partial [Thaumarchaeota archaeon]|nr:arginase family protein [Nitrososphaerota archaeon]